VRDWNLYISKTEDCIRHLNFFAHAECAQKNILRMLNMRKKMFTHAEHELKKCLKILHALKNVFLHAQPIQK
jgi:hypothetical protein